MGRFISDQTRSYIQILARVSSMGLAMVIATILGFALGYWIDNQLKNFSPWGKVGGLILGVVAGYRNIYIIWKRSNF